MADKNRNGIDDKYETSYGRRSPGDTTSPSVAGQPKKPGGLAGAWQDVLQGPVRGMANFAGSIGAFLGSKPQPIKGTNAGDQMFGVPVTTSTRATRSRPGGGGSFGPAPDTLMRGATSSPTSLLDYLAQATALADQLGLGGGAGGGGVDYSGAMSQARGERDRNSAYLSALYGQLRTGLQGDRAGIAQNYGGAIDRSQEIAQQAQDATRQAYDAAQAKQDQAVSALGMQQAAASQQLDRPTTQQQAADAIADSAARAQNAQTQYNSQQANATTHSQNVENASRFSEVNAQSALDASLSQRLSELAQLQAEQNAQRASQGSERGQNILSLASQLYSDEQNRSQNDFENQLTMSELLNSQNQAPGPSISIEDLLGLRETTGLSIDDLLKLSSARKNLLYAGN